MDDACVAAVYGAAREALLQDGAAKARLRRAALQAALMSVLRHYTDMAEADAGYIVRDALDATLTDGATADVSGQAGWIAIAVAELFDARKRQELAPPSE